MLGSESRKPNVQKDDGFSFEGQSEWNLSDGGFRGSSIGLENVVQILHPRWFGMHQASFEPMENSPIHGFSFSIWLRMYDGGESMFDMELTQELFEPSIIELSAIIHNNHLRETILTYYGFSNKGFSLDFGDVG